MKIAMKIGELGLLLLLTACSTNSSPGNPTPKGFLKQEDADVFLF
ncbi:hypothetical protein [Sutcliffiella horikoshii]|nr:hypothetical protein [Sutcliffiella horikoshii]